MSGFRLSAQQRILHDRLECDDDCHACRLIDAHDPEPRVGRELLTTADYEEYL